MIELSAFCLMMTIACRALRMVGGGEWLVRTGALSSKGAAVALAGALFQRALENGHWPFATTYEFTLTMTCCAMLIHLLWERKGGTGIYTAGAFALAPVLGLILWAQFVIPPLAQQPQPLPPVLRSVWFPLHTLSATLAYGAFILTGGIGVMRVLRPSLGSQPHIPTTEGLEALITRGITLGYPWLSMALIFGMVLAQTAWGSYWSWDPKEVWTLITWLFYTLFLHLRLLRGWRGYWTGWLALVGMGLVLFTLTGVGWLTRLTGIESLHVY